MSAPTASRAASRRLSSAVAGPSTPRRAAAFSTSTTSLAHAAEPAALSKGRLPASSLNKLIDLHHLCHPKRSITRTRLDPVISSAFKQASITKAEDKDLRILADDVVENRGVQGRVGDHITTMSESPDAQGPRKKRPTSHFGSDAGVPQRTKDLLKSESILFHTHSLAPTSAENVPTESVYTHWSESEGTKNAAMRVEESLRDRRERELEQVLNGESRASGYVGERTSVKRGTARPSLDAVLEYVAEMGGKGEEEKA